ncbi:hypothetical protein FOCG_15160 [Fusarium oxysporum f. sp. radicis-lycopersici 26381]|nr:hypothetical protein FOCG_15160 [Fusarium oxysporum f. sp. radicis-lycopersici 26381]
MATVTRLTTREHHEHDGLVIEQVRQCLYPHLEQLGAEKLIKGIVNETASMCTYLYPNADDEGIFLATGFMTVQFVNEDIFDSAAILENIQDSVGTTSG